MTDLRQTALQIGMNAEDTETIIQAVTRDMMDEIAIYGAVRPEAAWRERCELTVRCAGYYDSENRRVEGMGDALYDRLRNLDEQDLKVWSHSLADELRNRPEIPGTDKPIGMMVC